MAFGDDARMNVRITARNDTAAGAAAARASLTGFVTAASTGFLALMEAARSAAGVFRSVISETIKLGDQMNDLSRRLGIPVEALDKLAFIGKRSGIEIERLTVGVQQMARNLTDASEGTGKAADTLERLGIRAADIVGMSLDDQFLAVGKAIAGLDTPAQKVAASMDIFGRSGAELLQIFNETPEALAEAGAAYDKIGGLTSGLAAKAADAADQMDNWALAVRKLKIELASGFLPTFTKELSKVIDSLGEVNERLAAARMFGVSYRNVTTSMLEQAGLAAGLQRGFDEAMSRRRGAVGSAGAVDDGLDSFRRSILEGRARRDFPSDLARDARLDRFGSLRDEWARSRAEMERPSDDAYQKRLREAFEAMKRSAEEADAAVRTATEAVDEWGKVYTNTFGATLVDSAYRAADAWAFYAAQAIVEGRNVFDALTEAVKQFFASVIEDLLARAARAGLTAFLDFIRKAATVAVTGNPAAALPTGDFNPPDATYARAIPIRTPSGLGAPERRGVVLNVQVNAGFGSEAEGQAAARAVVGYARAAGVL